MNDYINLPRYLLRKYMKLALAHDEEIICENATVIANSNGSICWFDNDKAIPIVKKAVKQILNSDVIKVNKETVPHE